MSVLLWIVASIYVLAALFTTVTTATKVNGSTVAAVFLLVGIVLNVFMVGVMIAAAVTLQGVGL